MCYLPFFICVPTDLFTFDPRRVRASGFKMHVGARRRIGEWFVSASVVVEEVKDGEEQEAKVRSPESLKRKNEALTRDRPFVLLGSGHG